MRALEIQIVELEFEKAGLLAGYLLRATSTELLLGVLPWSRRSRGIRMWLKLLATVVARILHKTPIERLKCVET